MSRPRLKLLVLTYYCVQSHAMMIRNDALLSKMVSDFHKDNVLAMQQQQQQQQPQQQEHQRPKNVLAMMQNVLCKNFPTVPCSMIVEDETLKNLMQRSIQQLKYKKLSMEKTTQTPAGYHLTLFPTLNSEDMTNYLQVSDSGYYIKNKHVKSNKKHKKRTTQISIDEDREREPKKRKPTIESKRTTLYNGRKKIKKFYPHKIKYKDKAKVRQEFGDYSEEKLSMSVESPDMNVGGTLNRDMMNYKADLDDTDDSPVWRIDYLKHGEPSLNVFGGEPDRLKEKLVKTDPNGILSENMREPRQDVLHPDVYIKKNYMRKNGVISLD